MGEKVNINTYGQDTLLVDLIQEQARKVKPNNILLEYKILLSMAIRLLAEEFMITKISEKEKVEEPTKNQTRYLIDELRRLYPETRTDILRILDAVNIITPEQIHFNSFMYEPLVDMDILELLQLYRQVNNLDELWKEDKEE